MIRLLNEKLSLNDFRSTVTRHTNQEGKPVTIKWYDGKTKVAEVLVDTEPAIDGYRWIGDVEVNPKYRGNSLGTQVIQYVMDKYKAGALGVRVDNEIALKMYKKAGFKIEGETFVDDGAEHYRMYYKPNFDKSAVKER